jgi:hypothetical protein
VICELVFLNFCYLVENLRLILSPYLCLLVVMANYDISFAIIVIFFVIPMLIGAKWVHLYLNFYVVLF